MTGQKSQHPQPPSRRLAFIALWLLAQAIGGVIILVAGFFSLWMLPGFGMESDSLSWLALYALLATAPVMAVAMLASLVFALFGRRRVALLILVPPYGFAAFPFMILG